MEDHETLNVERVGDEVILRVQDELGITVVALPCPDGVNELIEALVAERDK